MAPMGPVGYADAFGNFQQRLQDYYVERARHGVGLIITGICSVDTGIEGLSTVGLPCPTTMPIAFIHSAYQMNERIHAYGAKCFLQLTGGLGRSALPGFAAKRIAPSEQPNRFDPSIIHREMTKEEILNLIQKFVTSAVIAKRSGFDGVEIHAVHEGYLLDQFAIKLFNQRTDEFGGSLENRLRVSTMIVQGIKKMCGPDFPVSLRYSLKSCMKALRQGGLPGEEYEEVGKDIPRASKRPRSWWPPDTTRSTWTPAPTTPGTGTIRRCTLRTAATGSSAPSSRKKSTSPSSWPASWTIPTWRWPRCRTAATS